MRTTHHFDHLTWASFKADVGRPLARRAVQQVVDIVDSVSDKPSIVAADVLAVGAYTASSLLWANGGVRNRLASVTLSLVTGAYYGIRKARINGEY